MTDTKNTVSDAILAHWIEVAEIVGENGTPAVSTGELAAMARELQSLRASIPGGVGVKGLNIGEGWETHSLADKRRLQHDAGIPHLPTDMTFEARKAVSGEGPRAYEWSDKKHRLVYDLCREIERLSALDLSPAEGETGDGSEQAAIEIADAVIAWMVRHDLLDADQEYRDDDIIAVLDELSPGLATTNDEAFASPLAAPSNPVISDEPTHRHKKRCTEYVLIGIGKMQAENWEVREYTATDEPVHGASVDMREVAVYRSFTDPSEIWVRPREEFEDGRFEALTAALSVKPQSGSDKP